MFTKQLIACAVALSVAGVSGIANADPVVVVGSKSKIGTLTKEQVANIFLGKVNSIGDVSDITPIDQSADAETRGSFYSEYLGKTASQAKAYWSKMVFTGKGNPPKEVASPGDVKKLLASNPSAVGYVEKSEVDGSVKIVLSQ